jgi:hypothetical protein
MTLVSNHKLALKAALLMVLATVFVFANSAGPPAGYTSAFGEPNCTQCHDSYDVDSGDGEFFIDGVPEAYTPGETYTITVSLGQIGQRRWGFQLVARNESDGSRAGTITVTDSLRTQILTQGGRQYIEHTMPGTYEGRVDGPVTWQFDWTAPDPGDDNVVFAAAGNAANGDGELTGDYIYTYSVTTVPAGVKDPE